MNSPKTLILNGQHFEIKTPSIMGILNITPDSFSDGGLFTNPDFAYNRALEMHNQGAQIIDIGAESTKPGSQLIPVDEELNRILPLLEKLPKNEFIISIDSNKFEVQRKTVELGAHLINDVFGGSESLFKLAEEKQIALVLMHTSGKPDEMQSKTDYKDVVSDILKWMEDKKKITDQYNIPKIWFDPGIGFGKTLDQNLDLMENIHLFTQNEFPILLGSSRKSWIGTLTNASVENRIGGSLASIARGLESDVDIFRVHDVFETEQFIRSYLAMKDKHRLPWTN